MVLTIFVTIYIIKLIGGIKYEIWISSKGTTQNTLCKVCKYGLRRQLHRGK